MNYLETNDDYLKLFVEIWDNIRTDVWAKLNEAGAVKVTTHRFNYEGGAGDLESVPMCEITVSLDDDIIVKRTVPPEYQDSDLEGIGRELTEKLFFKTERNFDKSLTSHLQSYRISARIGKYFLSVRGKVDPGMFFLGADRTLTMIDTDIVVGININNNITN